MVTAAWSTIRKATDEDHERLALAAKRFQTRHGLQSADILSELGCLTDRGMPECWKAERLMPLWKRCVKRALRDNAAEGIAWGYVGYNAD